uniref:Uncharacterized protein LOC100184344 n=1 Tax=Phallusia mammillata TaxID=59560 RepID=A0A6F9DIA0_9ASCI|nr:uncharacterized protein LOC100184344 [Phallusia mammillata]
MEWANSMVPHACFFIDSTLRTTLEGLEITAYSSEDERQQHLAQEDLERLWLNPMDESYILPCLSVRSGLDLFLAVKNYPPGSEIIMTSINIPSMVAILRHHKLKIKSCDMNISTLAPSLSQLEALISPRTVAVLVAHVYGKRFDMQPVVKICKKHNLCILEDCAEAFSGLKYKGHPESDLAFFSFGVIKFATAFGGSIVKINNKVLYKEMCALHATYPIQPHMEYAKKLVKYSIMTSCFNCPAIVRWGVSAFRMIGIDHKEIFVPMLRGFPTGFFKNIRRRPSTALLNNLVLKLTDFSENEILTAKRKGDYLVRQLPKEVTALGQEAVTVNYWLFPILVEQPVQFTQCLFDFGVDATRGTTQLQMVLSDVGDDKSAQSTPEEWLPHTKFIMDHVVYLPCHKLVPYSELDKIIVALHRATAKLQCKKLVLPIFP